HGAHWHPSWSGWAEQIHPGQVQRVFLNTRLWCHLADSQLKTADSYTPQRWGDPSVGRAPRNPSLLEAARGAHALYRQGEKARFRIAALLDQPPRPTPVIASLARELRREAHGR